jgi:hypothetical protein
MYRPRMKARVFATALMAAALMAVGASAASAAPTTFNVPAGPAVNVKLNGTLTMWPTATTCTFKDAGARVLNSSGAGLMALSPEFGTSASCSNGNHLTINVGLLGEKSGSAFSLKNVQNGSGIYPLPSPQGWGTKAFQVPWTNGSGSTPSKVTFTVAYVGETYSTWSPVQFHGSLNVSKADGSLLLLQ